MAEHPLVRRVLEEWYLGEPTEARLCEAFQRHVSKFTPAMDDLRDRLWSEVLRVAGLDAEAQARRDVEMLAAQHFCELGEIRFGNAPVQAVIPPPFFVFRRNHDHELIKSRSEPWGTFYHRLRAQDGIAKCPHGSDCSICRSGDHNVRVVS